MYETLEVGTVWKVRTDLYLSGGITVLSYSMLVAQGLSQLHELEAPGAIMSEIYEEGRLPTVHSLLNINRTFGIEPAAIHISPSPMTERPSLVEAELMQTPGDGTLLTIEEEESLARREGGKTKTFTAPPKSWRRQRKPINFVKRNVEAVATPALEHDCEAATVISPPPGEVYPSVHLGAF